MEKFSVEDILKEVKNMTGDNYYSSPKSDVEKIIEPKVQKTPEFDEDQISLFSQEDFQKEPEQETQPQIDLLEELQEKSDEVSAKELLEEIVEKTDPFKEVESSEGIVGGFTVKSEFLEPQKQEIEEVEEIEQSTKVFDKIQAEISAFEKQPENEPTQVPEIQEVVEEKSEDVPQQDFTDIRLTTSHHTPSHLLSADEIKSGHMDEAPSFRFGDKLKDLTKSEDDFSAFKRAEENEKAPEADADELFDILSVKYDNETNLADKISSQPDVLNGDIVEEKQENDKVDIEDIFSYDKNEAVNLEAPVKSTSDNRFARKFQRKVYEKSFDYSESSVEEEEVVDDYTCIEDEEAVRYDLDVSLKGVSKRLGLTIIAFVLSFLVTGLPSLGVDLFGFISPSENLTGFLIANAIVLGFGLIVNIASFFRGLISLITFKPDCDSPLSIATLLVVLQSVFAFVPEFSASADIVPFYTAGLFFAYILSLIGKKSMVARIKSNFRFVATTSLKQSCFVADETFGEMLENDDFIGVPYVATSKGAIDLQDYLKNSYCEDPSDNFLRIFSPISLVATIVTFVFAYFTTKDISIAFSYACAVAILATPASAIISVNAPIKKAAMQFRQKDGLFSGYNAVNEFSDIDCVAISSEDLFPAGSVELKSIRAIGDVSIEDIILKSASLGVAAGGPLADVFDKIIDGRRKMLSEVSDMVYEDGFGLTGKVDGKTVRIGNRNFMEAYAISGLCDDSIDIDAKAKGMFIVYTAIDDEVCGIFALKYKSIDPDIEDAIYDLLSNDITIAVKTNDPNITAELVQDVFDVPKEYILIMEAHIAERFDEITRPSKKGDSLLAYGGRFATFAQLIVACKKLQTKISVATIIQIIFTILGFGFCMFNAVMNKGFDYISISYVVLYQLVVSIISVFIPSLIKRIK